MKLKNYISIASLAILLGFASCGDQFDLDLQNDPNAVTEENADVDLFFNAIQLNFSGFFNTASNLTMPAVRMTAMTGGNIYENAWSPNSFNGMWNTSYATIFPDINAMIGIAEEREQFVHVGAAQVMQGYVLMTLVDFFGDIPWSDALQGVAVPSPSSDTDASVYDAAIALIDAGIENLGRQSRGTPGNDFFYGGDAAGWIRAANTFKLKAYLNMGNTAAFDAIIASGDYISSASQNFAFPYGTNRVNPNSRHPWYNEHYEVGNGRYHSNQNMFEMRQQYSIPDPRIRYYYYRQDLVFGDEGGEDQFALDCPGAPVPTHFPNTGMSFCLATDNHTQIVNNPLITFGYYGRGHGDSDGIPPDGLLRTNWGVYPAGGKFDKNLILESITDAQISGALADAETAGDVNWEFGDVKNDGVDGGQGAGIAPIMMSSFVDFMRAERALVGGDAVAARPHLENGIRNSINTVMSFGSTDPEFDISSSFDYDADPDPAVDDFQSVSLDELFFLTDADIDAFVAEVLAAYDAGDNDAKMNLLQHQNFLALFGNGYEAWNAYRRTGFPTDLQFTRDQADPGTFPRLMLYPADYVNLNATIDGNRVISQQVFWDTLPAGRLD